MRKISKYINRFSGLTILFVLLSSCIEEYNPEINETADLLVIQGSIIRGDTIQYVEISRSSPYGNPARYPVSECVVYVTDQNGREFYFNEERDGLYSAEIGQEYLAYESRFILNVETPDNQIYQSDPETIYEASPIDSLYFANESYQSSSEYYSEGLRLYADLKAPNENTRNYRWTITETWEYHSDNVIDATYDRFLDTVIVNFTLDYYYCWISMNVPGFYSASTENLTVNEHKRVPLNYLPGDDAKLGVKYCAHVKQYALGDAAYQYWNTNKVETTETGGLYQTQPSQSKSNFVNINDPDELILGFFWASSYTEDYVFFDGPFHLRPIDTKCTPDTVGMNLDAVGETIFNTYYVIIQDYMDSALWGTGSEYCYDCRVRGGSVIKPDFWED